MLGAERHGGSRNGLCAHHTPVVSATIASVRSRQRWVIDSNFPNRFLHVLRFQPNEGRPALSRF
jgi:hypothetical protein